MDVEAMIRVVLCRDRDSLLESPEAYKSRNARTQGRSPDGVPVAPCRGGRAVDHRTLRVVIAPVVVAHDNERLWHLPELDSHGSVPVRVDTTGSKELSLKRQSKCQQ